ncbi:MAG: hypothetical protein M9951_06230 [Burkholderiaceae bacterium]|nr:hypothetical protein [Burkholderiaceae bacterium]
MNAPPVRRDLGQAAVPGAADPAGRAPRIVFAMLSAATPAPTVSQLARLLAPHRVVIHHSPHLQPDFRVDAANIDFVPNPDVVNRGDWSMSRGVIRLLEHCLDHVDFDYFQLLTPNCLPVRPLADFVTHVATDPHDAHVDRIELSGDDLAWMTYAYRLYAPENSWRFRLLWRMHCWYVPADARRTIRGGLEVPVEYSQHPSGRPTLRAWIARNVTWAARGGLLGEHPFGTAFKPWVGSLWFGARKPVCHYLARRFHEPGVQRWFSGMSQRDEVMFPSLLANSAYRLGPGNHFIAGFDGPRTRELAMNELPLAVASGRFFARKFPDDPRAPTRRALISALHASTETTRP